MKRITFKNKRIKNKSKFLSYNKKTNTTTTEPSLNNFFYSSIGNNLVGNNLDINDNSNDWVDSPITFGYHGSKNDIIIHDGYAYTAGGGSGGGIIRRWDLSDPLEESINFSSYGTIINSMDIYDNYIYAIGFDTTGNHRIKRWELSNPSASPTVFTFGGFSQSSNCLLIHNGYIYAGGQSGSIHVIKRWELSNPTGTPTTYTGNYGGVINSIFIDNGYIYAGGATTQSIRRWDLNDPNVEPVTFSSYGGNINDIIVHNGYIYAGGQTTNAIRRWDLNDLDNFEESLSLGTIFKLDIKDNYIYAFVGTFASAFRVDLNNFTNDINIYSSYPNARCGVVHENYLYVGGLPQNGKLTRWDIDSYATMQPNTIFGSQGAVIRSIVIDNNYIYVAGGNNVKRWDINNPSNDPIEFSTYGGNVLKIVIHNGYLYAGGQITNAIRRWNLNNPSNYDLEFSTYGGTINDIIIHDNYIYAGGTITNAIRRWNLNDSDNHEEFSTYGGSINSIDINDTHIYAGGFSTNAIRRWDLTDLDNHEEFSSYGGQIRKVLIHNGYVYAGGEDSSNSNRHVTIKRWSLTDLTTFEESKNILTWILTFDIIDDYIYVGGFNILQRIPLNNLSILQNSKYYGNITIYDFEFLD